MKLYSADLSPFARKCRLVILEKSLSELVSVVGADPYQADAALLAINPLSRVPTLEMPDGQPLYDSQAICLYLDSLPSPSHTPSLLPTGDAQWPALRRMSLADGVMEATFRIACEVFRRPEAERSNDWIQRWSDNALRAMKVMDSEVSDWDTDFTLPNIGAVCAIEYLALRAADYVDWSAHCLELKAWYADQSQRDSVQKTRPVSP